MSGIPLSGIREIFEKAQSIPDVVRLEFGEPDFDTPEYIKKGAAKALKGGKTKYTSSFGEKKLREAIAHKMETENDTTCTGNNVIVTSGATSALCLSILACVNPGEEVLIPDPGWSSYVPIVRISGGVPVGYPLREEDGYQPDLNSLSRRITDRTKMILINSPNNPTGGIIRDENLAALGELAKKHNLTILSDEVYEKFVYDGGRHVSIASLKGLEDFVITVNSFSKTYAMTGWRVGYSVAPEPVAECIGRLNGSTNSCTSSISQAAALTALEGPQDSVKKMVDEFDRRRKIMLEGLGRIGNELSISPPAGAFYLFVNIKKTGLTSDDLAMKILLDGHVATVPGSAFGGLGEGYIRVAYANSEERLREGVKRIRRVIESI